MTDMKRKVDRLVIENFKSIRSCDIELNDINILIGSNGGGKSNFISFFTMLNTFVEGKFQNFVKKQGGANNLLYFGRKYSSFIRGDIYFKNNRYEFILEADIENRLFFNRETTYFKPSDKDTWFSKTLSTNEYESKLTDQKTHKSDWGPWKGTPFYVYHALKTWRVYHFHDTSVNSPMRTPCNVNENKYLHPDASNLPAFLYMLQRAYPDSFSDIENAFRSIAPFFDRFELEPDRSNPEIIRLEWKHVDSDYLFTAVHLSDGSLRMLALLTLLLQPDHLLPTTILIDEPELGLHPAAIELLSEIIKSVSKKSQIIISTQSPSLVSHFEPEDIIVVELVEKETIFKRLDKKKLEHWLEDYSLGELWQKNIIGGRP